MLKYFCGLSQSNCGSLFRCLFVLMTLCTLCACVAQTPYHLGGLSDIKYQARQVFFKECVDKKKWNNRAQLGLMKTNFASCRAYAEIRVGF